MISSSLADEADRVRGDLGLEHAHRDHHQVGELAAGELDDLLARRVDLAGGERGAQAPGTSLDVAVLPR
ncbi:MAG: hypothetical protein ACXVFO_19185 [Solirubrobacteraceae bacterium]